MRYLLLLLGLISTAYGQFAPTSAKTAFKNGISIGTRDSTAYAANDSLVVVINRQGRMMYRSTDGYWKLLANAASSDYVPYTGAVDNVALGNFRLTARSLRTDSIYANSSAGMYLTTNSGTAVAHWGSGGSVEVDFKGFAGYDANRSASYTARSFTDKNYVDSADALRLLKSDSATYYDKVVRTFGTQTVGGAKTFSSVLSATNAIVSTRSSGAQIPLFFPQMTTSALNDSSVVMLGRSASGTYNLFDLTMQQTVANQSTGSLSVNLFDNGGKIRLQEWTRDGTTITRPLTVNGNLTATSFIRSSGTSSQFLKADGSVDGTSYATAASISGTTNYIPKFTSSSAIGNSQIQDDGTNVGIGGSGVLKFDVIGNASQTTTVGGATVEQVTLFRPSNGVGGIRSGFNTTSGNAYIWSSNSGSALYLGTRSAPNNNVALGIFADNTITAYGALNGTSLSMSGAGRFNGSLNINGASSSDRMFQITGTSFTTGTTQFGMVLNPTYSGTITNVFGVYAGNNFSTGTITNSYNLFVEGTSAGSATITNKWGVYQAGTTDNNYFAGTTLINTTTPDGTNKLIVNGGVKGTRATFSSQTNPSGYFDQTYGATGDPSTAIRTNLNGSAGGAYIAGYNGDAQFSWNREFVNGSNNVARATNAGYLDFSSSGINLYFNTGLTANATYTPTSRLSISTTGAATFSSSVTATGATFDRTATGSNYLNIKALNSASNDIAVYFGDGTNNVYAGMMRGTAGSADAAFHVHTGGSIRFTVASTGAITATSSITATGFFESSDLRLKNIVKRDGDVVYFNWKNGQDKKLHIGYIAQEVQKTNPDQVKADEKGMLSVNYTEVLVQKVRELEKQIAELQKRIK